jgi:hypothetical protein
MLGELFVSLEIVLCGLFPSSVEPLCLFMRVRWLLLSIWSSHDWCWALCASSSQIMCSCIGYVELLPMSLGTEIFIWSLWFVSYQVTLFFALVWFSFTWMRSLPYKTISLCLYVDNRLIKGVKLGKSRWCEPWSDCDEMLTSALLRANISLMVLVDCM